VTLRMGGAHGPRKERTKLTSGQWGRRFFRLSGEKRPGVSSNSTEKRGKKEHGKLYENLLGGGKGTKKEALPLATSRRRIKTGALALRKERKKEKPEILTIPTKQSGKRKGGKRSRTPYF